MKLLLFVTIFLAYLSSLIIGDMIGCAIIGILLGSSLEFTFKEDSCSNY